MNISESMGLKSETENKIMELILDFEKQTNQCVIEVVFFNNIKNKKSKSRGLLLRLK